MNDNSFLGKMSIIWFYSVNVKGNWAHLTGKNSQSGAKITTIFKLLWKCFKRLTIKTFWKHVFYFGKQNHVRLFKVSF